MSSSSPQEFQSAFLGKPVPKTYLNVQLHLQGLRKMEAEGYTWPAYLLEGKPTAAGSEERNSSLNRGPQMLAWQCPFNLAEQDRFLYTVSWHPSRTNTVTPAESLIA